MLVTSSFAARQERATVTTLSVRMKGVWSRCDSVSPFFFPLPLPWPLKC
uniref:Uncharacterized protein n=1 Tax=Anguilla anguilla TaxID=7936 RepID=A0A0E9QKH9_ANGAN